MKLTRIMTIACAAMLSTTTVKAQVPDVRWDSRSLIIDGRRVAVSYTHLTLPTI